MVSAFGILLLSLSVIGFGIQYIKSLRAERDSVDGLCALAERISTRIRCFRQDINEIYDGFTHAHLDSIGFTSLLKEKGLSAALEICADKLSLGADVMSESKIFAYGLGKSYYDEQLDLCREYLDFIKEKQRQIISGLPSKTKLSISLSCAISALTAILFI